MKNVGKWFYCGDENGDLIYMCGNAKLVIRSDGDEITFCFEDAPEWFESISLSALEIETFSEIMKNINK